jgi:hypothetical protein
MNQTISMDELLRSASDKGYNPSFKIGGNYPGGARVRNKWTYIELCLMRQWLWVKHKLYCDVDPSESTGPSHYNSIFINKIDELLKQIKT